MAYVPTTTLLGIQPIAETSTTARHPLGTRVDAVDGTYGGGTFLYLKGIGSTVVGSVVTYDQTGVTTLAPITTKAIGNPLAVAMSANVASQYGWYQTVGVAVIKKTAVKVSPAVVLYLSGTAGRAMPTLATGREITGAITVNAATVLSATSTINAQIAWPAAIGVLT